MCNNFRIDLGKNLKLLRKQKGLTQENVFLESGISRSHIAMIEAGKRDISISALFKISRAMNVDLKEIFAFDDIKKYKFDAEELYE